MNRHISWRHAIPILSVTTLCAVLALRTVPAVRASDGVVASASGGGHYNFVPIGGLAQFAFTAEAHDDGSASGEFHHTAMLNGQSIDFHAQVTCLSVDTADGRAWIGGVITQNRSESPDFQQAIHQPGQDIWFRVLDSGEGHNAAADRTTFVGFRGSGGIDTSAQYCAARIWPAGNARTWEVTGNVQVK
jgi:hypothetical protein